MNTKVDMEQALELLRALPVHTGTQTAELFRVRGRVLAEDIYARIDVPGFDRSPYDGYAFRGADTAQAGPDTPVTLTIGEELAAGTAPGRTVTPGTAAKILTGAPIPPGADAVIKYELTKFTTDTVQIFQPVPPDTDIARAGEDVKKGSLLAKKGQVLTPGLIGVLAGQGLAEVSVYAQPVVRVMSTGSELLEPGAPMEPAKIYNSNVFTMSAFMEQMGARCVSCGSVKDDEGEIARCISEALAQSDMVVTTGGASVGDYDYAVRAAQAAGARILFWKIAMKPGGSVLAAEKDGKLLLCLSGNPAAAAVTLLRVAQPFIRRLCGEENWAPETMRLTLRDGFGKKSPQRRLVRGFLQIEDGKAFFVPNEGQGNGVISSFVGCDLLGEIPAGSPPLAAGATITAYKV